ncbi:hypothetical protein GcC1_180010 [Golovinomyces cichoracearum]|uniref:Chromosome transmission fidelity protein 4 n=1 Tax=Golovinomyces cichoracearum TaxID=62708 RepID=A0A420HN43_9PEZI|nr:hypothetical protein GcC1_180010 [Golovinomyces cichoracearum]
MSTIYRFPHGSSVFSQQNFCRNAVSGVLLGCYFPESYFRKTSRSRNFAHRKENRCHATINQHTNRSSIEFHALSPFGLRESIKNAPQPDERTVKLGKTLRTLQEQLPTLLQKPLPPQMLSPNITLNLFPSTHPHLPSVTGRVAYSAALWTSPIAWGRLPLISNVRLEILSERMIRPDRLSKSSCNSRTEKLVVRWRTVSKSNQQSTGTFSQITRRNEGVEKLTEWFGAGRSGDNGKEFTGLFIFEFDEEGRVLTHTIEHAQESGQWERGVGAKVVGLTDWLLGGMKGDEHRERAPFPAFCDGKSEQSTGIK